MIRPSQILVSMKTSSASPARFCFKLFAVAVPLALFFGLVGCHHHPAPQAMAARAYATESPRAAEAAPNDYHILPSDILDVAVFQETDLKSTLRVSQEGTIVFPLIGVVPVGGLTPAEAGLAIRDKLAKGFLINPQV